MITEDDARCTLELNDRYIIEPLLYKNWNRGNYSKLKLKNVTEKFSYTSNNNIDWLDKNEINKLLNFS